MSTNMLPSFKVEKISWAKKKGYVTIDVVFNSNPNKVFTYVRRAFEQKGERISIIDGFAIHYTPGLRVIKVEKYYDTTGRKSSKISDKVKAEAEEKGLVIPEVPEEIIEVDENEELRHEKYDQIKSCLELNIPIYLAGPAGSGKNFTLEQIANNLGYEFYFSNSVQQEFKLTGFIDAGGKFHETEFSKACKSAAEGNDVVFFLDEMDASIPEVLVLLNAAIANGYFEFPDGKINFGEKVHFVAAGNTIGSGADEMYTGRMVLDQATLDRFAIIEFDYSLRIELGLTHNNHDLVKFIHSLRDISKSRGVRMTFSYRCMMMVTKLENVMSLEEVLTIAVLKGLDKDTINTLQTNGTSKYDEALKNIQRAA